MRFRRLAFALVLVGLFSTALWAAEPNVVLISLDTFRADRLAAWGGPKELAPQLNALAARGTVFTGCFTPAPITLPAHATLLTGAYPSRTGLHDNGMGRLAGGVPTLAEAFAAKGYATCAVVASAVLASRYGLIKGFQEYDDAVGPGGLRTSARVTDLAVAAFQRHRGRPVFLWVHYFDTHAPYYSNEPFRAKFRDPYDASVACEDAEVGRFLRSLPEDTVVAVVSDHGEGLGDHGEATHGVLLHQATVRVVCILGGPGVERTRTATTPCSLADLAPTVAALAGVRPSSPSWEGEDLLAAPSPGSAARHFPLEAWLPFDEFRWRPLTGVTDGRYKWVRGSRDRLYDLERDPGEKTDEAYAPSREALALKRLLQDPAGPSQKEDAVDPALAGLGYVPVPAARINLRRLPSPEDQVPVLNSLIQARLERTAGKLDSSVEIFKGVVEKDPGNPSAWLEYGETLRLMGRLDAARPALEKSLAIAPRMASAWVTLGHIRVAQGQGVEAMKCYEKAVALSPQFVVALDVPAADYLEKGQTASARKLLDRVVASGYADARAYVLNGRLFLAEKNSSSANSAFEQAMKLSPDEAATLNEVAAAYTAAGWSEQGILLYKDGIQAFPAFAPNYLALAGLYTKMGEPDQALPLLRRALACDLEAPARQKVLGLIASLEAPAKQGKPN